MKRTAKTLLIAALVLLAATPALAGRGHQQGRIVDRLENQENRIEQGIDSGELTRREARMLEQQRQRIRRMANELYDDRGLSQRDRHILNEELDRASERIYQLKHNDESRSRHRDYTTYRYWGDGDSQWPTFRHRR